MSNVHSRIKQAREAAGLTQAQLAKEINSGRVSISRWETGEAIPSHHVLASIGYATGFSPDWLREGEGDPYKPKSITALENLAREPRNKYTAAPTLVDTGILTQALALVLQELQRRKATLPPEKIAAAVVEIYNLTVTKGTKDVAVENVTPFVRLLLA